MNPLSKRSIVGLCVVGDDLVVVDASARGDQIRWTARRVQGFLSESAQGGAGGAGGSGGAEAIATEGKASGVTLVWPSHRTLRRDVALGEQTLDELRAAVSETPDAFFPVSRDEALLWDAHEYTDADGVRRAILCAVRLRDIEPVLDRLGSAGLTLGRIVPSAASWSALRYAFDEIPSRVLERASGGWSIAEYEGVRWTGLRAGFGAPPPDANDADAMCDWSATPQGVGESSAFHPGSMHAEHAALGAAMLDLARIDAQDGASMPTIDLLRARPKRRFRLGALGWCGVAAAALVLSLLTLNDVSEARATERARVLAAEVDRLRPGVERVEALRARNDALVQAHTRLVAIESNYSPMARTLEELTRVTPASSSFDRISFADSGLSVRAISTATADLMGAIEGSPLFVRVLPMGGRSVAPGGVETVDLGFNFETPPPFASDAGGTP